MKKKRHLASLRSPGRFFQIIQNLKAFFNFFLKPFKKSKQIRQIADYQAKIPRNKVDFPSLVVHEVGHVPGRGHWDKEFHSHSSRAFNRSSRARNIASEIRLQSKSRTDKHISVMEPILERGRNRREITEYDLEQLFCAYYNY